MPPHDAQLNNLLHWAVENTPQPTSTSASSSTAIAPLLSTNSAQPVSDTNSTQPTVDRNKLDTAVLDAILGRTDAIRMREAMEKFEDSTKSIQERCDAGEEMEELVQDLDNANDMETLGFWPRLLKLLESDPIAVNGDNELIKFYACWICGTAVQNNPKSQTAFLKHDPLPVILEILSNSQESTQAKALYCLSSTLKHAPINTNAISSFTAAHGWETLHNCLKGPSMTLRRKTVFLINTLVLEDSLELEKLRSTGLLNTLITSLSPSKGIPTGLDGDLNAQDEDYTEKALRSIVTILINSSSKTSQPLSNYERQTLNDVLLELGIGSEEFNSLLQSSGIGESEWAQALRVLASST
ncbi:hypothetical protein O181_000829 [Austropuccinia psidii MF-1]|uniref:Nucleotide exchange factor Fes1 domain-containing protein n=1 Tax=Austropuccinia psidii MF-1 TaxID=1389203 RepID=A0A9Q3B9C0_9BASI|nr:hypothetical protein [Austropuccinia psidii MF-1]